MKLTIVGSGYVGLVAGTCFADSGNDVICVDVDAAKIKALNGGKIPIYEPGLEELVHKNVRERRLSFSTDLAAAVGQSDVIFIAVGTPEGESGDADLQYVLFAAEQIGKALKGYAVIVDKSTVPVGTADRVRETISKVTDQPFDVVSNPEFLKEGAAIDDFLKPDRVVIGTSSEHARKIMGELYGPFVRTENPILYMDPRSAELTKYAANAMLATRISFMNDMAMLCDKVGADVDAVRKGMGSDKRIGYPFLFPGVGYGGSCFPKDVAALAAVAERFDYHPELLNAVMDINRDQRMLVIDKLREVLDALPGRTIGLLGLAFKPNTDDMREAPSIDIAKVLLAAGASVRAYDPAAVERARLLVPDLEYLKDAYEVAEGADALVLITEWNEFRQLDLRRVKKLMRRPVMIDGRNIYDPELLKEMGFTYRGVGRE